MIGVDWGTTRFRAYRLDEHGNVRERRVTGSGILEVGSGAFAGVLKEAVADWMAAGERRVLLSGMVGSRQGWRETPYIACPAGLRELAGALVPVAFDEADARIVPGLEARDSAGVTEVMRGEETEIAGALEALPECAVLCLPGSHAKWVKVAGGKVVSFATYLTGEAFACLKGHTILGRMMGEGPFVAEAFERGVRRSGDAGGLLHHLFGVRALGLAGALAERDAASYLSGLLIGHEARAGVGSASAVHLIGEADLCARYARAIRMLGGEAIVLAPERAVTGLFRIAAMATWDAGRPTEAA